MNSLRLLKNRSYYNIENVFKSTLAKSKTNLLTIEPTAKQDNSNIHKAAFKSRVTIPHHHSNTETITKRLNIYITVDTQWFTGFRQLMMSNFKEYVFYIRTEPIEHARKMKVYLCFDGQVEDKLMTSIMRNLPSAQFGRISMVQN